MLPAQNVPPKSTIKHSSPLRRFLRMEKTQEYETPISGETRTDITEKEGPEKLDKNFQEQKSGTGSPAPKSWQPYDGYLYPRAFLSMRWALLSPLNWRLGYLDYTLGEVLGVAAMLAAGIYGLYFAEEDEDSGKIASIFLGLAYASIVHNSPWMLLLGLPFERALFWHKCFALGAVVSFAYHGIKAGLLESVDGLAFGIIVLTMCTLALWPVRRLFFNLFYYPHVALAAAAVAVGLVHNAQAEGLFIYGAALWLADVALRYLVFVPMTARKARLAVLPADVLRISFPRKQGSKTFHFTAGQYVWVCVPSISCVEWHPFSLSSAPSHEDVVLTIRALGNWTRRLHDLAKQHREQPDFTTTVLIEGPCGEPSIDVWGQRYKEFLFVSGGIGITPMQSMCSELIAQMHRGRPLKSVWFVWSVRDRYMVDSIFGGHTDDSAADGKQAEPGPAVPPAGEQGAAGREAADLPYSFQPTDLLVDELGKSLVQDHSSNLSPGQMLYQDIATNKELVSPHMGDEGAPALVPSKTQVLKLAFYLTKPRPKEDWERGGVRPWAQPHLRFGRPNLAEILQAYRKELEATENPGNGQPVRQGEFETCGVRLAP
eukprot:g20485.t1